MWTKVKLKFLTPMLSGSENQSVKPFLVVKLLKLKLTNLYRQRGS